MSIPNPSSDVVYEVQYEGKDKKTHGVFEITLSSSLLARFGGKLPPHLVADKIYNQHSSIYVLRGNEPILGSLDFAKKFPIHPLTIKAKIKGTSEWRLVDSEAGPWGYTLEEEIEHLKLPVDRMRGDRE